MHYRGAFRDYASAMAGAPKGRPFGFDAKGVPDLYIQANTSFNQGDYPVVFWLNRIFYAEAGQAQQVFDLGGGVGQSYYCYGGYLEPPAEFRWTVCDVARMAEAGEVLARERKAGALAFTTHRGRAAEATIFLTLGALQYIEEDFAAILRGLAALPRHVIVSRVPMIDGAAYYTVQRSRGSFYAPYKISNRAKFIKEVEACGYELVDQWELPRSLKIPLRPDLDVSAYRGLYFRRFATL